MSDDHRHVVLDPRVRGIVGIVLLVAAALVFFVVTIGGSVFDLGEIRSISLGFFLLCLAIAVG